MDFGLIVANERQPKLLQNQRVLDFPELVGVLLTYAQETIGY
ncbi:hypothetical protein SGADD02_02289 [Streptococcus gallolyticus]|uniref:Uncharacterized protein n=1 Tax=Streptococcus gallolyticus TaxID=315405 RepID=A0A139MDC8_9STRE|nr:hypothetical protein SGADD02_02289 [Streptococcus gallolyticus]